jgi:hypothetical protein
MDAAMERQLGLLSRMARLFPPVRIMGGYAEDALIAGTVTRPHLDVDWLFPRRETDLRLEQARTLGFDHFDVVGEAAPGEPFYLYGESDGLKLELGIVDEEDGGLWVKISSLGFQIDGKPAPAGYRLALPSDTFDEPPARIDGITVWPVSPLALYQMRIGIARQGSFGRLTEKQLRSRRRLKEAFFPNRSNEELLPRIEHLPVVV